MAQAFVESVHKLARGWSVAHFPQSAYYVVSPSAQKRPRQPNQTLARIRPRSRTIASRNRHQFCVQMARDDIPGIQLYAGS